MSVYLKKDGTRISGEYWRDLQADDEYTIEREYENERFRVRVRWHGSLAAQTPGDIPPEHRRMYQLQVCNRVVEKDGSVKYVEDPSVSLYYPFVEGAINGYENFLVENTDSEMEQTFNTESMEFEGGAFVEKGGFDSDDEEVEEELDIPSLKVEGYEDNDSAGSW